MSGNGLLKKPHSATDKGNMLPTHSTQTPSVPVDHPITMTSKMYEVKLKEAFYEGVILSFL